ncbi:MAG: RNA 3'-terminal phosphate cyclase [Halobacteriota archaeon]
MIEIDGSMGEGGGQVLRICLALAALTGEPIRIKNIRINRGNPGLRNQHLTTIHAIAQAACAETSGLRIGSSEITFSPGRRRGGTFRFDIKTAGSTTLILQSLIPVLAFADERSAVTLIGGTNNPLAPQVDYIVNVLNPILAAMGLTYDLHLIRRGFYPRGGGHIQASIEPVDAIRAIDVVDVGTLKGIEGISVSSNLPSHVAQRQAQAATQYCTQAGYHDIKIACDVESEGRGASTGSGIVLWTETSTGGRLGGDALGARGKPAELVGREAAANLLVQLSKGAPFDMHLGDQLLIWMALAKRPSRIAVAELTLHALTAARVIEIFTDCPFDIKGELGNKGLIQSKGGIVVA